MILQCCQQKVNKVNKIEILISKALIGSYVNHNKSVLANNAFKKYNEMKEEINTPGNAVDYTI